MTRVSIRRFDVIRAANIAAVLYAVVVLLFGLVALPFVLLAGIAGMQVDGSTSGLVGAGVIGAVVAFLVAALFYAIFGWIFTAIAVALFNLVAGRLGGLQADVVFDAMPPSGGLGYPPGYGAQPTPYPAYGTQPSPSAGYGGRPPAPPAGWGQPQG